MRNFLQTAGCLSLCLIIGPALVSGHEWRFGRARVEATVEAFDGKVVTFRRDTGRLFRLPVERLAGEDLPVLRNIVALKGLAAAAPAAALAAAPAAPGPLNVIQTENSQRSVALLERSLEVQTAQYWSQWYDLWIVQFEASTGEPFWITSPARNSYDAEVAARQRYPNASVLWVQRLNR